MKIYYQSGDLIMFDDNILGIVCPDEYILYFHKSLHFDTIQNMSNNYTSIRYRRIVQPLTVQPIVDFLLRLAKDISIKQYLECEFNTQLDSNVSNALIYYIYKQSHVIQSPDNIITHTSFFNTLELKNNILMKEIYLNI